MSHLVNLYQEIYLTVKPWLAHKPGVLVSSCTARASNLHYNCSTDFMFSISTLHFN